MNLYRAAQSSKSIYYLLSLSGAALGILKLPILSRIFDTKEFISYSALLFLGSTLALVATVGLRELTELHISRSLGQQEGSSTIPFIRYIITCCLSSLAVLIFLHGILAISSIFHDLSTPTYAPLDYAALYLCCLSVAVANMVSIKARCFPGKILLIPCFSVFRSFCFFSALFLYRLFSISFGYPVIGAYVLIAESIIILIQVLYIHRVEIFVAPCVYRRAFLHVISSLPGIGKFSRPQTFADNMPYRYSLGLKFGIANLLLSVIQIFDKAFVIMLASGSFALDYIQLATLCSLPSVLAGIEMQPRLARLSSIYSSTTANATSHDASIDSVQLSPRQSLHRGLAFLAHYRCTLSLSLMVAIYPVIPFSFPFIRAASIPSSLQVVQFLACALVLSFSTLVGQQLLFDHRPNSFLAYAISFSFLFISALALSSIAASLGLLCRLLFIAGLFMAAVSCHVLRRQSSV